MIVGVVVGLGAVTDGPEGDCCWACAAGMTKRPAAMRVTANRIVDCMSKLLLCSRANISSMMRVGFEIDHQICRFGLVGLKARLGLIGPTGEIHHDAPPAVVLLRLDGFHDIEALAVEEEGMTTE